MSMRDDSSRGVVRPASAGLTRLFGVYLGWYLRRHFHGVRIANAERLHGPDAPRILYLNHASWWDPLTCMVVARRFFPEHRNHAPMDAKELQRYRILGRLGMFGVEQGTRRGAVQFLRAGAEILAMERGILWITPQGAFADVRQRPPRFKPGLARLMQRHPGVAAAPLAIEYTFWDERLPEVLIHVGEAQRFADTTAAEEIEAGLTGALVRAQDKLAALAATRDSSGFETILKGGSGVGFVYDVWRRMLAATSQKQFMAEHAPANNTQRSAMGLASAPAPVNELKERRADQQ